MELKSEAKAGELKKQEFVSSETLYKIKKVSNQSNSPAADPSLKCQAKYDPETDQAIVFLNCKGNIVISIYISLKINLVSSCDNKYIWLQKEKNSLYYWKPQ